MDYYDGDVAYQDGWHYAIGDDNQLGDKLVLEDRWTLPGGETYDGPVSHVDGHAFSVLPAGSEPQPLTSESRYRLATDADSKSWHDRKHARFVTFGFEDGTPGMTVTADEMAAIQEFLDQRRAGQ